MGPLPARSPFLTPLGKVSAVSLGKGGGEMVRGYQWKKGKRNETVPLGT